MFKKFSEGLRNYKTNTKGMSFKQKVDYTWEYYKEWLWVVGIVTVVVIIAATSIININTEVILSGVAVNTDLEVEGVGFVSDDFYKLKKTEGRQVVNFSNVYMYTEGSKENIEATYDTIQSVNAQVAAKDVDYILSDEIGFEYCISQEIFMDLREFLSKDDIEKYQDKFIYAQEENSDKQIPVAIDITDSGFAKKYCYFKKQNVYFSVIVNTPRKEMCYEFLNYILSVKE